jgi:hypothetical protein
LAVLILTLEFRAQLEQLVAPLFVHQAVATPKTIVPHIAKMTSQLAK